MIGFMDMLNCEDCGGPVRRGIARTIAWNTEYWVMIPWNESFPLGPYCYDCTGARLNDWNRHIPGEGKLRQELIRRYVDRFGHLYARLEFHPNGTTYHPAINSTPADVARWLVEVAGDILKLED